jgi:hypothetical protein
LDVDKVAFDVNFVWQKEVFTGPYNALYYHTNISAKSNKDAKIEVVKDSVINYSQLGSSYSRKEFTSNRVQILTTDELKKGEDTFLNKFRMSSAGECHFECGTSDYTYTFISRKNEAKIIKWKCKQDVFGRIESCFKL